MASSSSGGACLDRRAGLAIFEVTANDVTYSIRLVVPSDTEPDAALPVVIDWHGLGTNGFIQAEYTGYEALADRAGFMAVHPTGPEIPEFQANGWSLISPEGGGRNDLAMASKLIDVLVDRYCADPDRIYVTGLSNGGFFTSILVCEMADRIAAAVSVAGLAHPDDCSPSRPVPYMALHGTADDVVPYDGEGSTLIGPDTPDEVVELLEQPIPDEFAQFAADYECDSDPTEVNVSDEVTSSTYSGCDGGVPLVLYTIDGGGHNWPGSPYGVVFGDMVGKTTTDIDATGQGWAFMSAYSLGD